MADAESMKMSSQGDEAWDACRQEQPDVIASLNKQAERHKEQGKYSEAEPLYQRVLYIQEQSLGPQHPEVATSLDNLAEVYREQGKYVEAKLLYQRALHIREQSLGPEHLDIPASLILLSTLYKEQGKYSEAELFYQRALHLSEQSWGPEDSYTRWVREQYTALLREIRRNTKRNSWKRIFDFFCR